MNFKKLNILLCCNLGHSTGVMVRKMREIAKNSEKLKGIEFNIEAYPANDLDQHIDNFDVILLGPQIKHRFNSLKSICEANNKPIEVINIKDYGSVNGGNILKSAILLKLNHSN